MGVKLTKIDALDDYSRKIYDFGNLAARRTVRPWFRSDFLYFTFGNGKLEQKLADEAKSFTRNIIASKRRIFIEQSAHQTQNNLEFTAKKKQAMLDTLLEAERNGQLIDSIGIQEEVDTFTIGGFDTTTTAMAFTLVLIANHCDVQKRLFEEISESVRNGQQNYHNLKYLDAVIKESLRLYPPLTLIGRLLGEDTILNGFELPAKTAVYIWIYFLHRDPKYFPDAEKFLPNRFLENEIKHPFAYAPFSAGQRNCIGKNTLNSNAILTIK